MSESWKSSFVTFINDVGPRPSDEYEIERVDVNGNYEPGNVIWIEYFKQTLNMRKNIRVTANGKTMCLSEWSRETGIHYQTLVGRYNNGVRGDKLLKRPRTTASRRSKVEWNGVSKTLSEWSRITRIPYMTLVSRAKRGKTVHPEELFRPVAEDKKRKSYWVVNKPVYRFCTDYLDCANV